MSVSQLIRFIQTLPDCRVHQPVNRQSWVELNLTLPHDLIEFYNLCDGVDLFVDQDYPYTIVSSSKLSCANPVIIGDYASQILKQDDMSNDWYIIAHDPDAQYLTIDLNPTRLGRCYDSFTGRHAIPSEAQIIALSFTDLLMRLVENRGDYPYWLKDSFQPMGFAYD